MKKIVIVLVVLLVVAGVGWSQEGSKPRYGAQLVIGANILAPIGVGFEAFLGPVGLEAELRGLYFGAGGEYFGTIDPAVNAKFYFSELDSTLYLTAGVGYATFWFAGEGTANGGLLQPRAALGYHALFGRNDTTRFGIELGGVWWKLVANNEIIDGDLFSPYFKLYFGRVF